MVTRYRYEWYFDKLSFKDAADTADGNHTVTVGMSHSWKWIQIEPNAESAAAFGPNQRLAQIPPFAREAEQSAQALYFRFDFAVAG